MMSGVTSPARPWFRLSTSDPDFSEFGPVKNWLHAVSQRMSAIFLKSNLYNVLPVLYGDLGVFGTSAMIVEEDFDEVVRFYPLPIGSYCIANDHRLKVNVFFREFRMTVRQLVKKFGKKSDNEYGKPDWSVFSNHVRSLFEEGQYETWIDVCHFIKPNEDYDPSKASNKNKKYESIYYEKGAGYRSESDRFLRESGYDFFPVLAPRWEITGEDVYGTDCPGMVSIGDTKQLQVGERRAAQAIEKMINPPMVGPSSLRTSKASLGPGDITYVDTRSVNDTFRPAHETNLRIDFLESKQAQVRARIQRAFYEDLFLMLAQDDRSNITATEISERKEEKLLALGPVLEQINQDLLDPLIDNVFDVMLKQGFIPPPPQELAGQPLKVEYISIMAQAQKIVGIGGVERFTGFVNQVAQVSPGVLDKINVEKIIDTYADMTSVPPNFLRSDEDVEKMRAQRAAQQQAEQQMVAANSMASTAKTLSETNTGSDSALNELIQQANAGALA